MDTSGLGHFIVSTLIDNKRIQLAVYLYFYEPLSLKGLETLCYDLQLSDQIKLTVLPTVDLKTVAWMYKNDIRIDSHEHFKYTLPPQNSNDLLPFYFKQRYSLPQPLRNGPALLKAVKDIIANGPAWNGSKKTDFKSLESAVATFVDAGILKKPITLDPWFVTWSHTFEQTYANNDQKEDVFMEIAQLFRSMEHPNQRVL